MFKGKKIVLVVDDEKIIVKGIKFALEQDNCIVDVAYDGETCLDKIKNNKYDIILLDIMLPKINGMEICKIVRKFSNIPIIMLTVKNNYVDKIMGFEYGADDYITKPFNILELKSRIKAVLRRSTKFNSVIEINGFKLNKNEKVAYINGSKLVLTNKEYQILELLMNNPNKVFNRKDLFHDIWWNDNDSRTVDVHITRLRKKINSISGNNKYICTKWGTGYYFEK